MKLRMGRYAKKLRQTKVENAKRLRDEQRRDRERAALEELHLRLKQEAARRPSEVNETEHEDERRPSQSSLSDINLTEGPLYLQTGVVDEENDHSSSDNTATKKSKRTSRMETRPFSPILPMINEDAEKECDGMEEVDEKRDTDEVTDGPQSELVVPEIVTDETMSTSSGDDKKKKKKKDVSFSDIIKLKYTGTKHLFDLVHTLAKRHGIPDVVEKVPDPRDNVVLRGSTNDSLRLQAAVLYPMMRGYDPESEDDIKEANELMLKSPTVSNNNVTDNDSDVNYDSDISEDKPKRHRKLSLEQRRAIYLSGKHSKSVSDTDDVFLPELGDSPEKYNKTNHRDRSMPELVARVSRIKHDMFDRSSDRLETGSGSLSPLKPSSSRSSRSLPAALKNSGKPGDKVSWTQAFGLLRAIHSLEDIS